ncbi:hypothetical protein [Chryseobacterium aquifrigidense]|uniref:Uncharacterized protein n=1 Tax=Chryseobacterium aquifrigidense TaxID=558021 RepID=A0A543E9T0_9FLAO|nr:hypothetical protein [Chryseobacterium aquifrigidense]TQM18352.1 hypothetical protein FB551_4133 [Chryseobacterium aquifrigidense]
MRNNKHWAEDLKKDDKCKATIRHRTDGTKNRKNVEISIILNCIEFGVPSVLGKDEEGITYRVPYNELEAIGIKE